MKLLGEFKSFIQRGNVIDLAVAVIIGAAFGKIVTSLVGDVLMPLISIVTNGIDIAKLSYDLVNPLDTSKVLVTLKYGSFLQAVIDFLIISFCVFLLVKGVNALHVQKILAGDPKPAELTTQEKLLTEIRDLLRAKQEGETAATAIPQQATELIMVGRTAEKK